MVNIWSIYGNLTLPISFRSVRSSICPTVPRPDWLCQRRGWLCQSRGLLGQRRGWLVQRRYCLGLRPRWLGLGPSWLGRRAGWLGLRPNWLGLRPGWLGFKTCIIHWYQASVAEKKTVQFLFEMVWGAKNNEKSQKCLFRARISTFLAIRLFFTPDLAFPHQNRSDKGIVSKQKSVLNRF